jgi:hypothetical protein
MIGAIRNPSGKMVFCQRSNASSNVFGAEDGERSESKSVLPKAGTTGSLDERIFAKY